MCALAGPLGRKETDIEPIRQIMFDNVPMFSVIDVSMVVTGKDRRHAAEAIRELRTKYVDEIDGKIVHLVYEGRGQRETPVADAKTIVKIIRTREARKTLSRSSCNL